MKQNIPFDEMQDIEFNKSFYSFCSYVTLVYDKKMNFATVFLKILENKTLRDMFVNIIDEDNEFGPIQKFIHTEPSICKSKYVTKFLNKFKGL